MRPEDPTDADEMAPCLLVNKSIPPLDIFSSSEFFIRLYNLVRLIAFPMALFILFETGPEPRVTAIRRLTGRDKKQSSAN